MFVKVDSLLWSPLAAASLHVFEEFAWPGGFPRWYRTYRGNAKSVNRCFLVIINAGLLITLFEGAIAGRTPVGVALLLTFSAILFSNGCWHLWASYKSHSYSPGVISGGLSLSAAGIIRIFWLDTSWSGVDRDCGSGSLGRHVLSAMVSSVSQAAQERARHDSE